MDLERMRTYVYVGTSEPLYGVRDMPSVVFGRSHAGWCS
jgi:hypothetical protein